MFLVHISDNYVDFRIFNKLFYYNLFYNIKLLVRINYFIIKITKVISLTEKRISKEI